MCHFDGTAYMLADMEMPRLSYLIASTMRTGSYLLCEALEYTAVAGHPREIFCPERRGDYAGRWELPADVAFADYLRAAIARGTTPNGVFGAKIHWHHLGPLALAARCGRGGPGSVLPQLFPNAKYIHLRRRDRIAQAISWYRAEVTNRWWLIPGVQDWDLTGREAPFDEKEIRRRAAELDAHQRGWDAFFAAHPAGVLEMEYEALAADYRGEVARALAFLGEDAALARDLPGPRLVRQADAVTEAWKRRLA